MQRTTVVLARVLGLALLLLCGGCDVEFPEQEVRFRHDVEADTLDVVILYRGVYSPQDTAQALDKGRSVVNRVLGGRREFMFMDWPLNFDLDEEFEAELETEEGAEVDGGELEEFEGMIERVGLLQVGAFLDEEQRLCGFQHFRITGVAGLLESANHLMNTWVQAELETGELGSDEAWFDEAEEEAWRRFTEAGHPWVSLEAGELVVRFPATARRTARFFEEISRSALSGDAEDSMWVLMLVANLAGVEVSGGVATVQVGLREGADTVLRFEAPGRSYSSGLCDLLVGEGLDLTGSMTVEGVRALLDEPLAEER